MIRPAKHEDVTEMVQLGLQMHQESNFAPVPYDVSRTEAFVHALVDDNDGFVFVSERDGALNGFMLGMAYPAWWGNGTDKIAVDLVLYVEPGSRHSTAALFMAAAFTRWAKHKDVRQIRVGTAAGKAGQSANAIYEYLGFKPTGKCFLMDMSMQHYMPVNLDKYVAA